MRLTLVNTATDGLNRPLGAMALAAYLGAAPATRDTWEVALVEIAHPTPWWDPRPFGDDVLQRVLATAPDVLGLSLLCWDREAQLALADRVRAERPGTRVVVGGPSATSAGVALLRDHAALDAVVLGEGEAPLAALLARWADGATAAGLPGVAWRSPDGAPIAPVGPGAVLPFAALPSPLAAGIYEPRWLANLELARGCRERCRYCAWSRRRGGWRTAPVERIRADFERVTAHDVRTILLLDSSLNGDPDHLARLVAAADALPADGKGLHGFVDLRALDAATAAQLARLPLQGVEVSLNSTNPAALRRAGRTPLAEADFERGLDRLAAICPVNLHLILGMPGDDLAGFRRTLAFVDRQLDRLGAERLPIVTVFWMMVEEGAPFWRERETLGLTLAAPGVPYVLAAGGFPTADLVAAARAVCDHPRAERFRLEGPRALIEGVVPPARMITPPAR